MLLQELLSEALAPSQRAETLRVLAELCYCEEELLESERLLVEALAIDDDPQSRVRTQLDLVYVTTQCMDFARAADLGHQALENLLPSDEGPLLAEALAYCAMADFLSGRGADWGRIERAQALEDPDRMAPLGLPPSAVATILMTFVGRNAEARTRFDTVRAALAERGHEGDLSNLLFWFSWLETRCGNFATAARLADEATTSATLTGRLANRGLALSQRAWVDAHLGHVAEARRRSAEAARLDERGFAQASIGIAATLALTELSVGDPEAAWRACRSLTEAVEQHGIGEPVPLVFLPDALEALVALGQLDRVEALLDAFERRGRELDRTWAVATGARCRGLLLAARGDLAGALAALDRALVEHERLDAPFERARTLLVKGVMERRQRRRTPARRALEEAAAEFERMGARLWAEGARAERGRLGGHRPRGKDELTPSEQRVVELAAGGLSNKEIAARLIVGVHTVEVHLSHSYAKLGVRSRSQLASRLSGERRDTIGV
jgi:DNA-binding CsgD family transcriptional regulator